MAWCHQATSHYLSQGRPRSMSPNGVTRPQWVNMLIEKPIYLSSRTVGNLTAKYDNTLIVLIKKYEISMCLYLDHQCKHVRINIYCQNERSVLNLAPLHVRKALEAKPTKKNAYKTHIECDIIRFLKNVPQILADKEVDDPIVLSSWIQALKKLMSIPGPAYLHWVNSVPPYVWKLPSGSYIKQIRWSIYRIT